MKKVFVTGGSSGIGLACCTLLQADFDVTAPARQDYDLENFEQIDQYSLGDYDIVINCAGNNVGTYLGFHQNSWQNQVRQINVNYISPLLMAKRYTRDRASGHFIYISSVSASNPEVYNVFSATAKNALQLAMTALSKQFNQIRFTEICPGRTRTNMLHQNYAGAKSVADIEHEYDQVSCLLPAQVADAVQYSIANPVSQINLLPPCPN